jgi:hypothetical protein
VGFLILRFFDRDHNQQKKVRLNLSPASLLSKLCDEAVLVGCHPAFRRVLDTDSKSNPSHLRKDGEEWGTRKI